MMTRKGGTSGGERRDDNWKEVDFYLFVNIRLVGRWVDKFYK